MKKHLIPFRAMPASWGLTGDAYAIAEANYNLEGEELERALAAIEFKDDPKGLQRRSIDIDLKYGAITPYTYAHRVAEAELQTDPTALALRKLEIEVANEKISSYDAARERVGLTTKAGIERDLAVLDLELQFNRIKKAEYEKQRATLKDEPWIAIINSGFDPTKGLDGVFFEFDWNAKWIEFLKSNGYSGYSDEQIVDEWFTDVCRSHNPTERSLYDA